MLVQPLSAIADNNSNNSTYQKIKKVDRSTCFDDILQEEINKLESDMNGNKTINNPISYE